MVLGAHGQWYDDSPAMRCDPAFTQIADRMRRQHKLLDLIGLLALEA
jgi:hypothetical protein